MGFHRQPRHYSVAEYKALLLASAEKLEYYDGQVLAMSGGTIQHGTLCSNWLFVLRKQLQGTSCRVFNSDVKVALAEYNTYVFPDLFVVCGPILTDAQDPDAISNPSLIVEVLSKSTAQYDQTTKFRKYRSLPSFQEYILVSQDEAVIETYFRKIAPIGKSEQCKA